MPNGKLESFEDFDQTPYQEETRERWGDTEAFKESQRRTREYSKAQFAKIKAESEGIVVRLGEQLAAGGAPDRPEAIALAEQHRLHIDRWFYPCDHAMHCNLADMYVADPRFTEYFERHGEGLAAFVVAAIRANADRP